jgi:hypothetical protein
MVDDVWEVFNLVRYELGVTLMWELGLIFDRIDSGACSRINRLRQTLLICDQSSPPMASVQNDTTLDHHQEEHVGEPQPGPDNEGTNHQGEEEQGIQQGQHQHMPFCEPLSDKSQLLHLKPSNMWLLEPGQSRHINEAHGIH